MPVTTPIPCSCVGPQKGEPYCPCMMRARGVYRKDGRWVEPEKDLGPARDIDAFQRGAGWKLED